MTMDVHTAFSHTLGSYAGKPVSEAIFAKQPDATVIVPAHKTAVLSSTGESQCDEHIREIAQHRRMAWQRKHNYGVRS